MLDVVCVAALSMRRRARLLHHMMMARATLIRPARLRPALRLSRPARRFRRGYRGYAGAIYFATRDDRLAYLPEYHGHGTPTTCYRLCCAVDDGAPVSGASPLLGGRLAKHRSPIDLNGTIAAVGAVSFVEGRRAELNPFS